MNLEKLDESEKFICKWQYGLLGDFNQALIKCIMRADDENLRNLSRGFPLEVNGYLNYIKTSGWWEEVQKKAEISD